MIIAWHVEPWHFDIDTFSHASESRIELWHFLILKLRLAFLFILITISISFCVVIITESSHRHRIASKEEGIKKEEEETSCQGRGTDSDRRNDELSKLRKLRDVFIVRGMVLR